VSVVSVAATNNNIMIMIYDFGMFARKNEE